MTAINIISVGVNCPELTSPKASWQTEGAEETHSFHSFGSGYRFLQERRTSTAARLGDPSLLLLPAELFTQEDASTSRRWASARAARRATTPRRVEPVVL